jgi:hypothetical protein
MRNSRLGCLTPTGLIAGLLTVLFIGGFAATQGGVLYSPGPLNAQAGEALGGVTSHAEADCKSCHVAPWVSATMADRCATCHVDVAAQMQQAASLHGAISHKNPDLSCGHCHPDHRGANAPLTIEGGADFPHDQLGFSLRGHPQRVTGEAFACSDCHTQGIASFDPLECQACHQGIDAAFTLAHAINYGTSCLACHDGVDRFGKTFSHNAYSFRLSGEHVQVNCVSCHTNARTLADFTSMSQDCVACHQQDDAHFGSFGADCSACHSPEAWKPAKFDHNLAAFKLEGEHAEAACEDCHQNGVYKGTPIDCYSCHAQEDEHGGRFGTDCGACHAPTDWDNAAFDHSRSAFPLTGSHERVQCEKCHQAAQFAGLSSSCVSCHTDPAFHLGVFGLSCEACHSTTAWSPATYRGSHPGIADEGGFGINHGRTTCKTCHPSTVNDFTCLSCHSDNFGGEGGDDD